MRVPDPALPADPNPPSKFWYDLGWSQLASSRLPGTEYHWDAKVDDDWVDPSILSRFAQVLTRVGKVGALRISTSADRTV